MVRARIWVLMTSTSREPETWVDPRSRWADPRSPQACPRSPLALANFSECLESTTDSLYFGVTPKAEDVPYPDLSL